MFGSFALLAITAFGHTGPDDAAARKAIEVIEAKIAAAMKAKDVAYLKSVTTDDFTVKDKNKTYAKADWVAMTTQTFERVVINNISFKIESIHAQGNVAILKTRSSMDGTFTKEGKKPQAMVDKSYDEETWVKTSNGWKFKKNRTIEENATLDGKPFLG